MIADILRLPFQLAGWLISESVKARVIAAEFEGMGAADALAVFEEENEVCEPPLRQQCMWCGDLFNVDHKCLRPRDTSPCPEGDDSQAGGAPLSPAWPPYREHFVTEADRISTSALMHSAADAISNLSGALNGAKRPEWAVDLADQLRTRADLFKAIEDTP